MRYIPHTNVGLRCYNFACDKIYVISDLKNRVRQEAFEEAWKIFNDIEFEFVQAVMADDLDFDKLIEDGTLDYFIDPNANISKTIIAVALSHRKVYEKINKEIGCSSDNVLIMEDDARPSQSLFDSIQDGSFNKLIKQLKSTNYDCFFWGRGPAPKDIIPSIYYEKELRIPEKFIFLGAQAYALSTYTTKYLLKELKSITIAADVFLDYHTLTLPRTFCSSKNLITQYGFQTHSYFGNEKYPKEDLRNVFKTSTQVFPKVRYKNVKEYGKDYRHVNPDIKDLISDIKDHEIEYTFGKPFETPRIEEGFWKIIKFKSPKKQRGTSSI